MTIYHFFTLGHKVLPLNKFVFFWGKFMEKGLFLKSVKNKFVVQHSADFWPFLRAPAEKLVPHSQSVLKVGYITGIKIIFLFFRVNVTAT